MLLLETQSPLQYSKVDYHPIQSNVYNIFGPMAEADLGPLQHPR